MEHRLGLGVHQDRAGVLVHEGGDGPDVVDVGMGDQDPVYLEARLLDRERDAGGLVPRVHEGARAHSFVPDDVAVLLKRPDGQCLEYHAARPRRNSTRSRAGAPVAPLGV